MKSHLEINPTPAVKTSTKEGISKKKILLFTPDFEAGRLLMTELKKNNPLIVETVDVFEDLIHEIARTTPHLVVLYVPMDSDQGAWIPQFVQRYFPSLPVCWLHGSLSENRWQSGLQEVLARPIRPEMPYPYGEEPGEVLHDKSLEVFTKDKLGQPRQEVDSDNIFSQQKIRFVLQLQTARKHHTAAKHYFECLDQQQAGLDQEIGYGLVHGSYKALSRSRDLACKWLALLAHYVPDVELEYLPKPGSPSCHIDFVHHQTPTECVYAATLILLNEVKPIVSKAIAELVAVRFEGQNDDTLLALSLKLYGTAKMLQQVGTAHVELMEAWINPVVVEDPVDKSTPRRENRKLGIYRDFYDFGSVVRSPEPITSVLLSFHAGTTHVQQERFLPSFTEFRRLCRSATLPSNRQGTE